MAGSSSPASAALGARPELGETPALCTTAQLCPSSGIYPSAGSGTSPPPLRLPARASTAIPPWLRLKEKIKPVRLTLVSTDGAFLQQSVLVFQSISSVTQLKCSGKMSQKAGAKMSLPSLIWMLVGTSLLMVSCVKRMQWKHCKQPATQLYNLINIVLMLSLKYLGWVKNPK